MNIYSLTHSAIELSGYTCTSSLTMNEKFRFAECGIENFEFIVSERVQANPDNWRAMSALTFLLFKLNTLHKETPTNRQTLSELIMTSAACFVITQYHVVQISQSENRQKFLQCMKIEK